MDDEIKEVPATGPERERVLEELRKRSDTHGTSMFGRYYQRPTEYHERMRWERERELLKKETGR